MAITGTFTADFTSFYTAVQKAETSLKSFETGAGKVETSLNRMVDSFSGRELIQRATLMTEAVERIGGVSTLTEEELARLTTTVGQATEKMLLMGQTVPPEMLAIADSAQQVTPAFEEMDGAVATTNRSFGTLSTGLSAADKTLSAFGVHLGPEIQGLREMEDMAGKTARQIGVLGTATAVAAAALAGWKVGRMIAEFFNLDEAIARTTAKLLGFGDVAAQEAGAKMDVLRRATQLAGREITDFAEAQRIIIEANKHVGESVNTSADRIRTWHAELARVRREGTLDDLKKDLLSQDSTLQELSKQYGVSVRALEHYSRQLETTADGQKAYDKGIKESIAKHKEFTDSVKSVQVALDPLHHAFIAFAPDVTRLNQQFAGTTAAEVVAIAQAKEYQAALVAAQAEADAYTKAIYDEAVALDKVIAAQTGANDAVEQSIDIKTRAARPELPGNPIPGTSPTGFGGGVVGAPLDPRIQAQWEIYKMIFPTSRTVGIASGSLGVPDFESWRRSTSAPQMFAQGGIVRRPTMGLLGERGAEAVIPLTQGRGLGSTTVTVNMSGMLTMDEPKARLMVEQIVTRALSQAVKGQRLL
jgi:hypothetical protein